jgi:hypothetical protein
MIAMLPFALALAGSSLILTVADEIPNYNMQPTCRAAVEMMGSQGRTVESCMRGETQAREELAKHWATNVVDDVSGATFVLAKVTTGSQVIATF